MSNVGGAVLVTVIAVENNTMAWREDTVTSAECIPTALALIQAMLMAIYKKNHKYL